jgi:hypothetical protein
MTPPKNPSDNTPAVEIFISAPPIPPVFTVFAMTICGTKTANAPISIDATPVSAKFTSERSASITHRKSSASRIEISCTEAYRSTKAIAMPFTVHKVNPPMKYKITDMPDITT